MVKYVFFIDSNNGTIGVTVDDGKKLSIDEYNALDDKGKPSIMELMQLLLKSCPEAIADFKEHLILVDDPEWDIREQLIFMRPDGGRDIIDHSYKADRADIDLGIELLPGISYKQLFKNTLCFNPATIKKNQANADDDPSFVIASPSKFSLNRLILAMKLNPIITVMVVIALITLSCGVLIFQSAPETIILAPDKLQEAAQVDQQLNELKLKVDELWINMKGNMLLSKKEKRLYWQKLKPLNLQYRELRRSGYGHGNKFKTINATLKNIRARLRPKKKAKTKVANLKKKVKVSNPAK